MFILFQMTLHFSSSSERLCYGSRVGRITSTNISGGGGATENVFFFLISLGRWGRCPPPTPATSEGGNLMWQIFPQGSQEPKRVWKLESALSENSEQGPVDSPC